MKVKYFFRKSRPEFKSIEELFSGVISEVSKSLHTERVYMPYSGATPKVIRKNLKFVKRNKGEINHITGDIQYAGIGLGKNTILTIHDIYSAVNGNWFKRIYITLFWFILPATKVKVITTISETSKKDLEKIIPFASSKIRIVHNAYRKELVPKRRPENQYRFSYPCEVLIIGTKPNKNLENIVPSLKDLNVKLKILGRLSDRQTDLLEDFQIDYINYFDLDYHEVIDLYLKSHLLCFPSLYEGFGMPIIEAQALGIPVITSNFGAMKEVAGDSACLVNPLQKGEIRNAVIKIMDNQDYRNSLIQKGYGNIKRFEPERIAQQYLEIYRELAGVS